MFQGVRMVEVHEGFEEGGRALAVVTRIKLWLSLLWNVSSMGQTHGKLMKTLLEDEFYSEKLESRLKSNEFCCQLLQHPMTKARLDAALGKLL